MARVLEFVDAQNVKEYFARRYKFAVSRVRRVPLKVDALEVYALTDSVTPERVKRDIRAGLESQRGFWVETPTGNLRFVVSLFDSGGACCFVMHPGGSVTLM